MRDDDHGHVLGSEVAHGVQHLTGELGVEGGGRLVEEHDVRLHGKGARDGDALLLSARELARVVVLAVGESNFFEEVTSVGEDLVASHPLDVNRCLDEVLDHGHVGKEVELLKDHARRHEDPPHVGSVRVGRRCRTVRRMAEHLTADRDVAAVDRLQSVDAAQER